MMFNQTKRLLADSEKNREYLEIELDAINESVATITFSTDGTVLNCNQLLLDIIGYESEEVVGQHHSAVCFPETSQSQEYRDFWARLGQGERQKGVVRRRHKNGNEIWMDATYFPVKDKSGKVIKVRKIASDVTRIHQEKAKKEALFVALDRSMAAIIFTPQGNIIHANDNFLATVGYELDEITGQHHRMFCDADFYEKNPDFWAELESGQFKSGQYQRRDKFGNEIWLEATYNPIFGDSGRVEKVVKFASNITTSVQKSHAVSQAAELAHHSSAATLQHVEGGSALLKEAVDITSHVTEKMQSTAEQLHQLTEHAQSIEEIVTTINQIAEQTNLLALNAAIEAARAGEMGRGFAVVADEVRSLAKRTSESTTQIANVVDENRKLTQGVSESMEEVVAESEQSREKITSAEAVMRDIYAGAEEVSDTVQRLAN
ncbi:PAS domain S-box protein [Salinivibrio sp. VYel1]|nr:PAS domain-containing methyl-accepting chemotaxis protein [Salinivibrio sp. VYel1]MPX89402.1 PAS domain S-box protein [Salinivibrio sp. VYel1]